MEDYKTHMYKKNTIALVIVATGLAVSIFTLWSPYSEKRGIETVAPAERSEPFLSYRSAGHSDTLALRQLRNDPTTPRAENLTDLMGRSLVQEIVRRNPSGPLAEGADKLLTVPSLNSLGLTSEDPLQDAVAKTFDVSRFSEADIVVSSDNSVESQLGYLFSIGVIASENFRGFDKSMAEILGNLMSRQDRRDAQRYAAIAAEQIVDLLTLEAPLVWKTFHLQNLNLWHKKRVVFEALLNVEQDALKSLVALQKLPGVVQETRDLQLVLTNKFIELAQRL